MKRSEYDSILKYVEHYKFDILFNFNHIKLNAFTILLKELMSNNFEFWKLSNSDGKINYVRYKIENLKEMICFRSISNDEDLFALSLFNLEFEMSYKNPDKITVTIIKNIVHERKFTEFVAKIKGILKKYLTDLIISVENGEEIKQYVQSNIAVQGRLLGTYNFNRIIIGCGNFSLTKLRQIIHFLWQNDGIRVKFDNENTRDIYLNHDINFDIYKKLFSLIFRIKVCDDVNEVFMEYDQPITPQDRANMLLYNSQELLEWKNGELTQVNRNNINENKLLGKIYDEYIPMDTITLIDNFFCLDINDREIFYNSCNVYNDALIFYKKRDYSNAIAKLIISLENLATEVFKNLDFEKIDENSRAKYKTIKFVESFIGDPEEIKKLIDYFYDVRSKNVHRGITNWNIYDLIYGMIYFGSDFEWLELITNFCLINWLINKTKL